MKHLTRPKSNVVVVLLEACACQSEAFCLLVFNGTFSTNRLYHAICWNEVNSDYISGWFTRTLLVVD